MGHDDMVNLMISHHPRRGTDLIVLGDGEHLLGHNRTNGSAWLEIPHQVHRRDDADRVTVAVDDRYGTDFVTLHQSANMTDARMRSSDDNGRRHDFMYFNIRCFSNRRCLKAPARF